MQLVNWVLLFVGEAVRGLWALLKTAGGTVWAAFVAIVNPILSPVLDVLNPVCTAVADAVYGIVGILPAWLELTLLSALMGAAMLLVFRYTSNQDAIGRIKDEVKANLLALKLYKDELHVTFLAQRRLFWALARLQRYMLPPVAIMILPMLLVLGQMGTRYQWRPLRPSERTLVKLTIKQGEHEPVNARLERSDGLAVEVGPVPGGGQLVWRAHAGRPGRHVLRFHVGEKVVEKELVVGQGNRRLSAARIGSRWTEQILHPVERRLPSKTGIESIEIDYPENEALLTGTNRWLIYFFVVSMLTAIVLAPVFKTRF